MPHRPLVLVTALTVGDYLLWNWSLNSNHAVLALVSGLTLPPLGAACLWLAMLTVARFVARSARRPAIRLRGVHPLAFAGARSMRRRRAPRHTGVERSPEQPQPAATSAARSSSRRLAA